MHLRLLAILPLTVSLLLSAADAPAQEVFESVGERALGMGGAFVAVANDATAVHWNPAGLATAGPAGMTIGWHRFQFGDHDAPPVAGVGRRRSSLTSLGSWPLGLSYGRFESTVFAPGPDDGLTGQTLRTSYVGLTILQSVVDGLVVGSTLKYVRGSVAEGPGGGGTAGEVLEAIAEQSADSRGAFDLDLGLMADLRRVRFGLTWKNLRSPSFGDTESPATTLQQQARFGLALLPVDGLTLAMDVDLDAVDLRDGPRRMFAVGGEGRLGSRFAVRSGYRWSLEGPRRPVGAVGASVAVRAGLWLDGHYAQGRLDDDREFGVALRAGF